MGLGNHHRNLYRDHVLVSGKMVRRNARATEGSFVHLRPVELHSTCLQESENILFSTIHIQSPSLSFNKAFMAFGVYKRKDKILSPDSIS